MTQDELKILTQEVIAELKKKGTNIADASVVSDISQVNNLVAYGTDGKVIKVTPQTIQESVVKHVTWNDSSRLNDFTAAGVYEITGERKMSSEYDNLPIKNRGGGHTISARLEVLDSSINDTTNNDDKCITQKLTLSNRVGGDGNVYIRTGRGRTYDSISWEPWATLQTNINVGEVRSLNNFVDNGIYSGVWTDRYNSYAETFVMITVNDYAIAGDDKTITQFKYAYDTFSNNGVATYKSRSLFGGTWSDWKDINEDNIKSVINNELSKLLNGTDPDKIDSLKDLITWVEEHGAEASEMASAIQANTTAIQNTNNSISTLNTTIINYNQRYRIQNPVTKEAVIKDLLNKYTADKGTIVTYYAEDGWHTIQYKLNYYRPTQGTDESNWVEIGGGGTGDIADGAVTERKLSTDVKNKLNTAYDKATLADNLFINDGITFIQGALHDEGDIYEGTNFRATSLPIYSGGEKITVNSGYKITKYVWYYDGEVIDYGDVNDTDFDSFELAGTESAFIRIEVCRTDNKAISRNEYPNIVKSFIRKPVAWSATCNMNNFVCAGRYTISGSREANANDNIPIYNGGNIEARLEVIENENTLVQILTLLNVGGGDGNIYTRTRQDNTWGQWGKLQTNVEVGVVNQQQMDALVDNGIYSGILSTTGETFVLVVINNYAIATQAGYGGYISHLKYSVGLDGVVKVETRRRDAFGSWGEWQGIGGGKPSELLVPSEWQGKLSMLSDGVHEFYGDCSFGKSGTLWGWADSYRYNVGEPTYIKLIKKGQDTALAQAIGTAASATRMINIQTETLL